MDGEFVKVAIVGSRNFSNYDIFCNIIWRVCSENNLKIEWIISGGARGADSLAERYAKENNINITIVYPKWDLYGKSAGIIRNHNIIKSCDVCIAFWDGESMGTKNDIDLCEKFNTPCFVYDFKKDIIYKLANYIQSDFNNLFI